MKNRNNGSRSAAQTAADVARATKGLIRVIRAAMLSGLHSALTAATKELLPSIIKWAVIILVVSLMLPFLILAALPNIFFGFDTVEDSSIEEMTSKALDIGGAYMSVEEYEKNYMDSVVTSLTSQYESEGIQIDGIEVTNVDSEEDLFWLIAINSAAHQQDLNEMSAEEIRDLTISRVTHVVTLKEIILGEGSSSTKKTTLKVDFDRMEPEELMDKLEFDEDERTWAGALFESLSESEGIEEYKSYYTTHEPNYGGDTSGTGFPEHGTSFGNEIDTSGFVDPTTKNNLDLAAYAVQAWENNWGYVWGTYGDVLTGPLFEYKCTQYPDGVGNYADFIRENWVGRRTTDCAGLVKGYGWLDPSTSTFRYGSNGMPDYGADQLYSTAVKAGADHGKVDNIPEIPGLILWKSGHMGVYVGGGYAVEAMGTTYGVVRTKVEGRGWQGWCKLPYITYLEEE